MDFTKKDGILTFSMPINNRVQAQDLVKYMSENNFKLLEIYQIDHKDQLILKFKEK
jgi:hypothetical protein